MHIKGVPKRVSNSYFRVYVGQNNYYQYILNFWFDITNYSNVSTNNNIIGHYISVLIEFHKTFIMVTVQQCIESEIKKILNFGE